MSQPALRLRVRNFLGVKKADVELSKITLIGGINGAGKSSLIEALASVALETPLARGMHNKKQAANLLHLGSEAGSISLDYAGGGRRITYPQCEVEMAGKPVQMGTSLGIGSARFMDLKPEGRRSQISQRFQTEPKIDDLRAWFAERPEAGMTAPIEVDGVSFDPVGLLWERVEVSGWDAVHKSCVEHSAKTKGAWQAVTGANWGARLARTWNPPELLPGETYDLDREKRLVAEAQDDLEGLIAAQAIAGRDRDLLNAIVATEGAWEAALAEKVEEATALTVEADELVAWEAEHPEPVDTSGLPSCPHCQKPVRIVSAGNGARARMTLTVAPEPMPKAAFKAAREAFDQHTARVAEVQRLIAENDTAQTKARGEIKRCEDAHAELAELQESPPAMPEALERARTLKSDLERKVAAIENLARAKSIFQEWLRNEMLVEALHPDGVRCAALSAKLGPINASLGILSAKAKWAAVELTTDMDATYDGRPYVLLSESERWRVDLTLTALLGQQEGARLIVVDRLDILAPGSRPGALYLLRHLQIPALVAMTAKSLEAADPKDQPPVPDLEKVGFGRRLWIENGSIVDPHNT